jgi:hypothetical protein
MGEVLWRKFVDECIENMQEVLITVGVNGLLSEYDQWLESNGYIKQSGGAYICHKPRPYGCFVCHSVRFSFKS